MSDERSWGGIDTPPGRVGGRAPPAHPGRGFAGLTTREAAAALGVSEQSVRRAIARGTLPAVQRGRAWQIKPEDVARYARRRARPEAGAPWARIVALPALAVVPVLPGSAPASSAARRKWRR